MEPTAKPPRELNKRELAFVEFYVADRRLCATQAAIRAGYSRAAAKHQAHDLLRRPEVAAAIAEARAERAERLQIEASEVLLSLAYIAESDMTEASQWGPDGLTLFDSTTLPKHVSAAIKKVTVKEIEIPGSDGEPGFIKREFAIEMHDKGKALALMGQHLGLFKQVLEHRGKLTLDQLMRDAANDEGDI